MSYLMMRIEVTGNDSDDLLEAYKLLNSSIERKIREQSGSNIGGESSKGNQIYVEMEITEQED